MLLGAELKKARLAKGLTQLELALRAHIDVTHVSLMEHDRTYPSIPTLFRLCQALDIAPHVLIARLEQRMRAAGVSELRITNPRPRGTKSRPARKKGGRRD